MTSSLNSLQPRSHHIKHDIVYTSSDFILMPVINNAYKFTLNYNIYWGGKLGCYPVLRMGGVGSKKSCITSVPSDESLITWKASNCIPLTTASSCTDKDKQIDDGILKDRFTCLILFSLEE